MWDYLQTQALDPRFMLVAGYLGSRIEGKTILDLDCGTTRFLSYIPQTFKQYYGNDISSEYLEMVPDRDNVEMYCIPDTQMVEEMEKKHLDILCVWGHGAGHVCLNDYESKTLDDMIRFIMKVKRTQVVVLECCQEFEDKYQLLTKLMDYGQHIGYHQSLKVNLSVNHEPYQQRVVMILEQ